MNKKRILITGGEGFIGSHLAKYCINQGHDTFIVDDLSGSGSKNFTEDLSNEWCVRSKFHLYKPDIVFHLAAYASEGRSNYIRRFIHYNNTLSTCNIINACVKYKAKLIFTSSVAVYSGLPPFSEKTDPNPIDEYGLSKYMCERSIVIAADTQGLQYCIVRPRNVYGPNQNIFDPSRNLFGIFCFNVLNNLPLKIFGDGLNKRSFTYIDDLIPALYQAAFVNNEIINLGSANVYSIQEATDVFCAVTGYNNVIHIPPRHEVKEAFCLTGKCEDVLGYKDKTSLKDGLTAMWKWAQTVPMQALLSPPPLEVDINIHESLR